MGGWHPEGRALLWWGAQKRHQGPREGTKASQERVLTEQQCAQVRGAEAGGRRAGCAECGPLRFHGSAPLQRAPSPEGPGLSLGGL